MSSGMEVVTQPFAAVALLDERRRTMVGVIDIGSNSLRLVIYDRIDDVRRDRLDSCIFQ